MGSSERGLGKKQKNAIYAGVAVAHLLAPALFLIELPRFSKSVQAEYAEKVDVIKATTVDEAQIQQYKHRLKDKERRKKEQVRKERERLEQLKRDAEEKRRLEELKKQQALAEKVKQEEAKKRKAIALKKKKEAEKRKKELQEKLRLEELERKRKEKLAKQKRAQEEKERIEREKTELQALQRQQELAALLEQELRQKEEEEKKERAASVEGKYVGLVTEAVRLNLTILPDFSRDLTAKVNVKLSPEGVVLSVRTLKSSGNIRYDKAINTALYQSSPLPVPSKEEIEKYGVDFTDLNLNFDMKNL